MGMQRQGQALHIHDHVAAPGRKLEIGIAPRQFPRTVQPPAEDGTLGDPLGGELPDGETVKHGIGQEAGLGRQFEQRRHICDDHRRHQKTCRQHHGQDGRHRLAPPRSHRQDKPRQGEGHQPGIAAHHHATPNQGQGQQDHSRPIPLPPVPDQQRRQQDAEDGNADLEMAHDVEFGRRLPPKTHDEVIHGSPAQQICQDHGEKDHHGRRKTPCDPAATRRVKVRSRRQGNDPGPDQGGDLSGARQGQPRRYFPPPAESAPDDEDHEGDGDAASQGPRERPAAQQAPQTGHGHDDQQNHGPAIDIGQQRNHGQGDSEQNEGHEALGSALQGGPALSHHRRNPSPDHRADFPRVLKRGWLTHNAQSVQQRPRPDNKDEIIPVPI
ncbi:hypothetical protein CCC_00753 [Paramagnetospirillum magnetotacticum MS-1]|uniref:Uncharacterized protein n=1 Tax=Paramagnetospirillum magnetotacticum MS-1 TaxID=272627 RepID=A0A0C2U874_PARME|nr:hypothetical protein CCC_00753 [Paramagnetospirillum magnetotacticum MS-1]